jgi:hypothetical protein
MLSSTASSQLQSQRDYRQQQQDSTGQNKQKTKKTDQLSLFIFKPEFLKI